MFEISVEGSFAAAHYLNGYQGQCENLHGHNYRVEIALRMEALNAIGLGVDFTDAKRWLKQVLDPLDHKLLNELPAFATQNPSAETIAKHIFEAYKLLIPATVTLAKVTVWETEKNKVSYWE
jgi:6-pyruvoyltetrahydropterin/6-carboxytetrahydropterin synthase